MKLLLPLMSVIALTILGLTEVSGQLRCHNCAIGWSSFEGSCYRFFPDKVSWLSAQYRCENEGANLVSIHSEAENTFAYALVITLGCKAPEGEDAYAWIGFHQPSGPFAWSDGSATDFTNWAFNQPDNYNDGYATEDCGHFRTDPLGSWNDYPCNTRIGYVCKKSASYFSVE